MRLKFKPGDRVIFDTWSSPGKLEGIVQSIGVDKGGLYICNIVSDWQRSIIWSRYFKDVELANPKEFTGDIEFEI